MEENKKKLNEDELYQQGMDVLIKYLGYNGTRRFLEKWMVPQPDWLDEKDQWWENKMKDYEGLTFEGMSEMMGFELEHPPIHEPPDDPEDVLYRLAWEGLCNKLESQGEPFLRLIWSRKNTHDDYLKAHKRNLKNSIRRREDELKAFKNSLIDKHRPVPREERDVINDALFLARQKVKVYPAGELVEVDGENYIGA
jgi:hypothetical protein